MKHSKKHDGSSLSSHWVQLNILVLLWMCTVVSVGHAQEAAPTSENNDSGAASSLNTGAAEVMSINDVRPGMKGYGVTVFDGRKREKFDVEILGVTRSMTPGSGVVLARLSSPHLKQSGLIAGMSGTPVYIRPGEGEKPKLRRACPSVEYM